MEYGFCVFFCFKQKTAYEMRISDWSSDVCSSDLRASAARAIRAGADPAAHLLLDHRRRVHAHLPSGAEGLDPGAHRGSRQGSLVHQRGDRKSVVEGKSVTVRVDLGGRRMLKKQKVIQPYYQFNKNIKVTNS